MISKCHLYKKRLRVRSFRSEKDYFNKIPSSFVIAKVNQKYIFSEC